MRKPILMVLRAGLVASIFSSPGWAQTPAGAFPAKPVTVVLPYAPGGGTDTEIRLYIPRLTEGLGQPVVVDYKPGAGASIGTIYVAKAAPDGYTMLLVTAAFTVYPAFYPLDKQPYDPVKDFAPVSLTNRRSSMLIVPPSLGVKSFPEYVAYAKTNPGKINYGTSGNGGIQHIVGAWLQSETDTKVTFIHYKGAGPMYADLMAGRLTAATGTPLVVATFIKSGKMLPLATLSAARTKVFSDLKTVAEYGFSEFDYTGWGGILTPARTPESIVNRLSAEFSKVAKAPEVIKKMEADSAEMVGSTPDQFRKTLLVETARWRRIVQENSIKKEE